MSKQLQRDAVVGFTLLEVTVALAILGLGLVAVVDLNAGAMRLHEESEKITIATELARSKLVDLEDRMNQEGFSDFDKEIDGTFEEEGRPEISWKAEIVKPDLTRSTDQLTQMITGAMGGATGGQGGGATGPLASLLGGAALTPPAGSQNAPSYTGAPTPTTTGLTGLLGGAATGLIQSQVEGLVQQIQKGVREVRLSVSWKAGTRDEGFTVTTHMVVLNPTGAGITTDPNQAANTGAPVLPAPGIGLARPAGGLQ